MFKHYKTLVPYLKEHWHRYLFGLFFLILTDGGQLFIPQLIKNAVNLISGGSYQNAAIARIGIYIVIIAIFIAVGRFGWRYFIHGASRRIELKLRDRFFEHLLSMDSAYFKKNKTGDFMARAINDMNAIRMATGMAFIAFIDGLFFTITILIVLFTQYPRLTLYTIIPLPVITVLIIFTGPLIMKLFKGVQESFSRMSDRAQESVSGVRIIKSFVQEQHTHNQFEKDNEDYKQHNLKLIKLFGLFFPIVMFISGVTQLVLIRVGAVAVIEGPFSLGDLTAFLQYLGMLIWPMMGAGFTINLLQRGAASMERINEVLFAEPSIQNPEKPLATQGSLDIKVDLPAFSYEQDRSPQLSDIHLTIPAGTTLGIIGRTGSGKSTLLRLLARIEDTPRNSVFIGGVDIHDLDLGLLRSLFAYVPQDTFLFSDTITRNILFGRGDEAGPELAREMAEISTISRDLGTFPLGLETEIGERGITLSGGQKQRVSISRALAVGAPILIFDDALSSVDTQTEELILSRTFARRKGMTNIIVSHRISTLKHADTIVVLDQGNLIQQGSHSELMAQEGFYSEIAAIQQSGQGKKL